MTNNENSTKYWAERQESYVAKLLGGCVQPGSGNGKYKKSDVSCGDFLIECKTATTEKSQFTIKKEWLSKLKSEALMNHKNLYALAFNFGAEANHNFFVLDEQTFYQLKSLYDDSVNNN